MGGFVFPFFAKISAKNYEKQQKTHKKSKKMKKSAFFLRKIWSIQKKVVTLQRQTKKTRTNNP